MRDFPRNTEPDPKAAAEKPADAAARKSANTNKTPEIIESRMTWMGMGDLVDHGWEKLKRYSGPLSYAFNMPASAALVWNGIETQNPIVSVAGGASLLVDALVIWHGSRKKKEDTAIIDPQDEKLTPKNFLRRMFDFKKYPYEAATICGEIITYGSYLASGIGSSKLSHMALSLEGAAQLLGVGLIMVPERETPPERYKVNIPYAPSVVNAKLESLWNTRLIKKATDFIVTHPAAASNVLPTISFAAYTGAVFHENAYTLANIPAHDYMFLGFGWASVALYNFVQKRMENEAPEPDHLDAS